MKTQVDDLQRCRIWLGCSSELLATNTDNSLLSYSAASSCIAWLGWTCEASVCEGTLSWDFFLNYYYLFNFEAVSWALGSARQHSVWIVQHLTHLLPSKAGNAHTYKGTLRIQPWITQPGECGKAGFFLSLRLSLSPFLSLPSCKSRSNPQLGARGCFSHLSFAAHLYTNWTKSQ